MERIEVKNKNDADFVSLNGILYRIIQKEIFVDINVKSNSFVLLKECDGENYKTLSDEYLKKESALFYRKRNLSDIITEYKNAENDSIKNILSFELCSILGLDYGSKDSDLFLLIEEVFRLDIDEDDIIYKDLNYVIFDGDLIDIDYYIITPYSNLV